MDRLHNKLSSTCTAPSPRNFPPNAATRQRGDFQRVHLCPTGHGEIPDEPEARLVVLGVDSPYWRDSENPALTMAKAMLENRGNSPRLYRNALVFLAVDRARLADLDEAVRRYLAWESILAETEELDLSPHQQRQATTQREAASGAVNAHLPEAYQWLLVPTQPLPQGESEWQALRLTGQDGLAVRASRKLKNDGLLDCSYAPTLAAAGTGSNSAVARRARGDQATERRFRPLSLPAPIAELSDPVGRHPGRTATAYLVAGYLRLCREFR